MKLLSLSLVLLFSASSVLAQDGGARNPLITLTPRVKTALGANQALRGSSINVDTELKTHTVTLTGVVLSAPQKALAGAIARRQAGTFQVRNRLLVRAEQSDFKPTVPLKYERTLHFLQLLAKSQGRSDGTTFRQRKTRFPDVKRLMSFISARGVVVVDVNENGGKPLVLSRARLERDLKRTGSSAFDSFAYVGYIFAMPYAQYSQLTSTPTRNGVVIEMPSGHRLTWEREGGRLQLRNLEYLRLEGD